jgi:hypothetical protein
MSRVLKGEAAQGQTNTTLGPIRWMVKGGSGQLYNFNVAACFRLQRALEVAHIVQNLTFGHLPSLVSSTEKNSTNPALLESLEPIFIFEQ